MQTVTPPDVPEPLSASFTSVLLQLVRHPQKLLRLWNWKSAVLSICMRGPIFLAASLRLSLHAAVSALVAESFFCVATAGFYGAIVQSFRMAQPQWLTLLFLTVILPAIFQGLEYVLHWSRGTPHLRLAEIVSICVSGLSAAFNWYVMRRSTLLVGPQGSRFTTDLRRLPRLILSFLAALPRWLLARRKAPGSPLCSV
jgi:hypothetical protein